MKRLLVFCVLLLAGRLNAQTPKVAKDSLITNFFKRTTGMIAADGGYTIPLNNGKVLWIFGDSYMNDYDSVSHTVPCLFEANNSVLLQPKNDWNPKHTVTLPGSIGTQSYFKNKPDNFIWPLTGFQHGDTVYVICSDLYKYGPGQYDMKNEGSVWAKILVGSMRVVTYSPLQDFKGIAFGQGFIKSNGYVYTYGLKQNNIYVARFPEKSPNAPWSFWNGDTWTADVNKAATIANVPGFSMYMCKVKNKYVLLSTEFSLNCDAGKKIYAATSSNPAGPFTERKVIYIIDDKKQGHTPFFYGPLAHPEYINSKNELLIDYSINGYAPCIPSCNNGRYDPDNYRPRAIWVPLKLIDPEL